MVIASPTTLLATGFHYVPATPGGVKPYVDKDVASVDWSVVLAWLGNSTYGGPPGGSDVMTGAGVLYRQRHHRNLFSAWTPQVGFYLFSGTPSETATRARQRFSMQLPLALHYTIQLYRDDRPRLQGFGSSLVIGPVLPLTFDITADGWSTTADLGVQLGIHGSYYWQRFAVEAGFSYAKFIIGYIGQDDLNGRNFGRLQGRASDYALGLRGHFLPWNLALFVDMHLTESLANVGGDSIYIGDAGLQVYF